MKVIIFSPTSTRFELDGKQPLGGADQTLLKLIEILAKEHDVKAYIPISDSDAGQFREAEIYPFMDAFKENQECDLFILYRKLWAIPPKIKYDKIVFYSQDMPDTPCFDAAKKDGGLEIFEHFDRIIALSKFHKGVLSEAFRIPSNNIAIIGNAYDFSLEAVTSQKIERRCIYTSTPYRGLPVLTRIWKKIVEKYPDATLDIYSSMKIYGESAYALDDQFKKHYEQISKLPGVKYYGTKSQDEVMKAMAQAQYLLYPNTYPETFCNVVNEAKAYNVVTITSDKGALKETGGFSGIYIPGDPYSEEYQQRFLEEVSQMFDNEKWYKHHQEFCANYRNYHHYEIDLTDVISEVMRE